MADILHFPKSVRAIAWAHRQQIAAVIEQMITLLDDYDRRWLGSPDDEPEPLESDGDDQDMDTAEWLAEARRRYPHLAHHIPTGDA